MSPCKPSGLERLVLSLGLGLGLSLSLGALTGCGTSASRTPDAGTDVPSDGSVVRDGSAPDANGGGGGGGDGSVNTDGGPDGPEVVECPNAISTDAPSGQCTAVAGDQNILIRGNVATPTALLRNGSVLVNASGTITCAGCNCDAEAAAEHATILTCRDTLVGPGLINAHEHLTYANGDALFHGTERYNHRHDWRRGQDGHAELDTPQSGGNDATRYAELRHLMGGATSVNGSGSVPGLLRNLDRANDSEGLGSAPVRYQTFPLDDSSGQRRESGCDYKNLDSPEDSNIKNSLAYTPHIAEGIGKDARNEFLCLSRTDNGGEDVLMSKTAIIHGIGLLAIDYAMMAAEGASLIWSPRSNIDLYGHTAAVTVAAQSGIRIALGTDWPSSGSMNMLRELHCAHDFNATNLAGFFSARQLYDMATIGAAAALKSDDKIGSLAPGRLADITIFDASQHQDYDAAILGENRDVVLVLRAGKPLFGDDDAMGVLLAGESGCEAIDVCGRSKRVCAERETGMTVAAIRAAVPSGIVPLFSCGAPTNEPTCTPLRPGEFDGVPTADDTDGDGIPNATDDCATIFNAPRGVDGTAQADADNDGVGDACDVCPLTADSLVCEAPDPDDRDGDGFANAVDNCPDLPNPDQADADGDLHGDVCDACAHAPNPGDAACPASIYSIKRGEVSGNVALPSVVVTGVAPTGYFVQALPTDANYEGVDWSGLFVYTGASETKPSRGDQIQVQGEVNNFYGQQQLTRNTFELIQAGVELPAPVAVKPDEIATNGTRAAALEGMLVEVSGLTVASLAPPTGPGDQDPNNEFVVDGGLRIDDFMFLLDPMPAEGTRIPLLRGILRFANNDSKLEPRDALDVLVPVQLLGIEPPTSYVEAGFSGEPVDGPVVVLSGPAPTDTTITLKSSAPSLLEVPGSIVVLAGEISARIPMTADASPNQSSPNPVVIEATHDDQRHTAEVIVFDAATPRTVEALTIDTTTLPRHAVAHGTVVLSVPAATLGEGQVVQLTLHPAALATVPAQVVVAAGARSATFEIEAGDTEGQGSLTAAVVSEATPSDPGRSVDIEVAGSLVRAPGVGDLMITEVHRNPSGDDEKLREWFEVFNASSDTLKLDGLEVRDNGATVTLVAPDVVLAPGAYGVIAYSIDPATNGGVQALAEYGDSIVLSNNNDELELSYDGTSLDLVDWGTGWPGGGQGVAMCLRLPYADDNNVPENWSNSVGTFGTTTDQGSPGVASDGDNCP
ncbi:MAG: amidohydrolase family protein [Deltaproteobacteria bacterium]|nr:amidohydrolase family protein [Deltaproteobacteria bacterium]